MTFGSRRDLATAILIACGVGWAILAAVDITISLATDEPFPAHPVHSLLVGVLITSTLSCLAFRIIQLLLLLLQRIDRVEASVERVENRLIVAELAQISTTTHFRGVVPRARVPLMAAATDDMAAGQALTAVRTMLTEETNELPPRLSDVERAEERFKGYLAGLNDRDWNQDGDATSSPN